MNALKPILIRPRDVPVVFGISRATLYRWAKERLVAIHKRGPMSFVRVDELEKIIVGLGD